MLCIKVKIISNKKISQKYFKIRLEAPNIVKEALPGQFIMAKVGNDSGPLLRRPFSIHRVSGKNIEIIYEIKGKGTQILSRKNAGTSLDVIGPLGNGFTYGAPEHQSTRAPVLVAGGMGIAPLVFLAEKLAHSVERIAYRKNKKVKLSAKRYPLNAIVLIGARSKSQLSCEKEFKKLGCDVKIATDDGSAGFKGRVTDLLRSILATCYTLQVTRKRDTCYVIPDTQIYACGPKPMLKEVARISNEHKIPAQISLEEYMACGIGACLGCVVQTEDGFKRVCKEGPVFDAREIVWHD